MTIVVELPVFNNESGGIMRQTTLARKFSNLFVVEIPKYVETSGGIQHMKQLSMALSRGLKKKYQVQLRIQTLNPNLDYSKVLPLPYTVGLPDQTFPASDVVITYSDNPYTEYLTNLPQVKKVLIYMLSYGMCFERERKNVFNPKLTVMSSTLKIKKAIEAEGGKCACVGFGSDSQNYFFRDKAIKRQRYASLLYHYAPDKQYALGVEICNDLCNQGLIDGTIVFGTSSGFENAKHPEKLIAKYVDANKDTIREIFNKCSIFIMPSISEGLNLTPIESTLCGCPSVICDGAFDDVFFDKKTCLIAEKKNKQDILRKSKELLNNTEFATMFQRNIEEVISNYTWEKTIENIERLF
ncbi:MAG: glycosyltransferase [Candidatus Nanoarchaeia archaeon]|jgi:hypothetical protein|nr:glycosyltransferase [Candidatus Nanoarchaeia archaeon]